MNDEHLKAFLIHVQEIANGPANAAKRGMDETAAMKLALQEIFTICNEAYAEVTGDDSDVRWIE